MCGRLRARAECHVTGGLIPLYFDIDDADAPFRPRSLLKSLTANRKLLKANPPLTSVTSEHHGVPCVNHLRPPPPPPPSATPTPTMVGTSTAWHAAVHAASDSNDNDLWTKH
ncbi:hypothetical protein SFRURICE_021218 [Spodoptera frugiperda]|nr:hypothetical protein SFRURICE_021218 [Spodoptera frugiperda]